MKSSEAFLRRIMGILGSSLPAILLVAVISSSLKAAMQGPPTKPWDSLPTDRERQCENMVKSSPHLYEVVMDAAIDGVMTRMPSIKGTNFCGWQPNRFMRIENIGETDVVNPWLIVNGRRPWRTLSEIASQAVGNCVQDSDKARAIWEFTRHHRFHASTWDWEIFDAVKAFNVYGYTLCYNDSAIIADLWKAAGLKTRRGYTDGHEVSEVFYDGDYHLLDGDTSAIYLERDNETIASETSVVRDHDLIKRTHTGGILSVEDKNYDQFTASLYGYEGEREGTKGGFTAHTMDYTLRPGESIEWRWDNIGKEYTAGIVPEAKRLKSKSGSVDGVGGLRGWGESAYSRLRNGKLRYVPELTKEPARRGLIGEVNLARASTLGLQPQVIGVVASATWRIASPYVLVGGKVTARLKRLNVRDRFVISISLNGKDWQPVWEAKEQTGEFPAEIVLDEYLSPRTLPQYSYQMRVEMNAAASPSNLALEQIIFDTDVQMADLALPELEAGTNSIEYVDQTRGPRQVLLTHSWVERKEWHPPVAPILTTPDKSNTVEGTQVTLHWQPAAHPDGVAIVDYQLQVSVFPDLRWVLSPNFDRLLSKTAFAGKTEWTVPAVGLLNPGKPYYWRVRARDANRVWGPWSKPSSFICGAPGVPLNVTAQPDPHSGKVILTWQPNSTGATAKEFRVYASDEKGFTISDTEYLLRMGKGFCNDMADYETKKDFLELVRTPANFLAVTAERSFTVVGPDLTLPNANKCYYRVVAVDARGNRSGPSDYAEAPRPFLVIHPPDRAVVGQKFNYQPVALRSIGGLLSKGEAYKVAFWDREEIVFGMVTGPPWLSIDLQTGELSGTPGPESIGRDVVILRATDRLKHRAEQEFELEVVGAP